MNRIAPLTLLGVLVALVLGLTVASPAAAAETGTPTQAQVDGTSPSSSGQATWADYSGGVAARPFVTELRATTADVTTRYVSGQTAPGQYAEPGQLTAIIAPINLCGPGQSGNCYATPNRIAVTFAIQGADNAETDLATNAGFGPDTVIDITIDMNTFGGDLRWTWLNGDLSRWAPAALGSPGALVTASLKPTATPFVGDDPSAHGCTATPITSCDVQQASADILSAGLVFSVDDTLPAALTGAAFATQGALFGYLEPQGNASAPVLDLQMASSHLRADGQPQLGTLEAVLPANSLINLYGVLPADSSTFFATTRTGSTGTNSPPTYEQWRAAQHGTDGLLVTVSDITFSAPDYQVKRKVRAVHVTSRVHGKKATLRIRRPAACKSKGAKSCRATIYVTANDYAASTRRVGAVALNGPNVSARVRRGAAQNYSVSVRTKKASSLVSTAAGSFLTR